MTTNSQYELNKGLAQMLKGGVIMDVTLLSRLRLQRPLVHVLLWHLRESLPISGLQVVFRV